MTDEGTVREGRLAYAVANLIETFHRFGFRTSTGMNRDEDLDLTVAVYRDGGLIGCTSFHMDGTWACYLDLGKKVFRCDATPWFKLPDGFEEAAAPEGVTHDHAR